jgi:hypothetical protein
MVTQRDFTEATEYNFWEITVDHRDSGISTVIPSTHLICYQISSNLMT